MKVADRQVVTQRQHDRLSALLQAMDAGKRSSDAGRAMGVGSGGTAAFLMAMVECSKYPPERDKVLALLALPVASDAEARRRGGKISHRQRGAGAQALPLAVDDIEQRKQAAAAERTAREAYWLQVEAEKYGLPRPGRPLSGMVA